MPHQSHSDSALYTAFPGRDLGFCRWIHRSAPGLGNLLFPWARCVVASARYGLPILWPTWRQTAIGPLVRQQQPRFYGNLFSPSPRYIQGRQRRLLLRDRPRYPEQALREGPGSASPGLYEFSGIGAYFEGMLDDHALVKSRLLEIVRPQHLPEETAAPYIGVHVRLGDFSVPRTEKDLDVRNGPMNFRMPIEWYVFVVRQLKEALGDRFYVKVFSDGSDLELAPLLALPNTARAPAGSPLLDLLRLSLSTALVASGSTYSMWASYLGRMPVIWHRGQLRQALYQDHPHREIEIGSGENLGREFTAELGYEAATRIDTRGDAKA